MMCDMLAICSKVPPKSGVNPFLSKFVYIYYYVKTWTVSLNNDVKICYITGSNVIGLKFEGSDI